MAPLTRLGLQIPLFNLPGVGEADLLDTLSAIGTTAEESGFDALWVMDHLHQIPQVGPSHLWMLEGNMALMALAARTRTARLGLMVGGVTYRSPSLHAKMTTTLDVLSGGRAIHGIGAAWYEDEHVAYGFDFPPLAERFERLEDHLRIVRAMFTQERATVRGTHHSVHEVMNNPRPVAGDIPIMVGGGGERKTLRLVARYADASNVAGDLETVAHKLAVLDRHCEEVGRDPATITRTRIGQVIVGATHEQARAKAERLLPGRDPRALGVLFGDPDEVAEQAAAFYAAGVDGLVLSLPDANDLDVLALAGRALRAAA